MKKILIKKTCESKKHSNIKMEMKFDRKKNHGGWNRKNINFKNYYKKNK
jgi:hypothetical protein